MTTETNDSTRSVTLLGLGAMGQALARSLLKGGHRLTVWNRTASRADALVADGARRAATPAEAVAAGPLVIVCLLDHDSVEQVLEGVDLAERTVVNLTNGTPEQARALSAALTARGAGCLDGGIMAIPSMIGGPGAFLFFSGPSELYELQRPVLDVFGEGRYQGADPGAAALWDVALLSATYGMFGGMLHAFALGRSAGIAADDLAGPLAEWLTPMLQVLPAFAEQVDSRSYAADGSNLAMQLVGADNLIRAAEEQVVSPELLVPLREAMARRVAAGHGGDDIAGLVEELVPGLRN